MEYRFIADVHLGKLAKLLRMLGFDTLYDNTFIKSQLITIALQQNRILLSRSDLIRKNQPTLHAFTIKHEDAYVQLKDVIQQFTLKKYVQPFTRCLVCNGALQPVSKENIIQQLPQNTALYFNEFWQCNNCLRIYWKGAHYTRMLKLAEEIMRT